MLCVSIFTEYATITTRLQQLENTVSTSVETALDVSMASEELFTDKFMKDRDRNQAVTSYGIQADNKAVNAFTQIRWYNKGGEMVTGSAYLMSKYSDDNYKNTGIDTIRFPTDQDNYTGYLNNQTGGNTKESSDIIYNWLFGGIYSDYSSQWYAVNENTKKASEEINRKSETKHRRPNEEFKKFATRIGYKVQTVTPVKKEDKVNGGFTVEDQKIPAIAQMGLTFGVLGNKDWNKGGDNADLVSDNFIMTKHIGKSRVQNGGESSRYYLTPYSLGVTYVPTEVFKPVLASHIQQMCLFGKLKDANSSVIDTFDSGIGCITTNIFSNGSNTPKKHSGDSNSSTNDGYAGIVNDGYVEYDLSTLKTKVDYTVVNFYDETNEDTAKIVAKILGSKASSGNGVSQSKTLKDTVKALKESDTMPTYLLDEDAKEELLPEDEKGSRIVARITTKIKVHVPYNSSVLQWADEWFFNGSEKHYGIKLIENLKGSQSFTDGELQGNSLVRTEDGIWYQYTTYRAISR